MCGIFGFVDKSKKNSQEVLKAMSDLLKHRGPDDLGFFIDQEKGICLGHRRLAIIDLSPAGHQPMTNENGAIQIIYNGEIYNFLNLKQELMEKGHVFASNTDTEVVIHAYEEYGVECLQKFNGMFAFALWDKNKNQLILARDRIGIKPLYYLQKNDLFAWASETKAFKALGDLKINQASVKKLLGCQYLPSNQETTLQNVYKVPPSHYLIYDLTTKELKIKQYWQLQLNENIRKLSFIDAQASLEKLLIDSIKLRLIADVEVGIMLSGGLDSSIIAALAQRYAQKKVRTFTAGFDNKIDERPYARIVAKHIGAEHEEIIIEPKQVIANIEKLVWHFDDLNTFDGGLLTNYLIAQKMKERGVKVILLGEGGDEIAGGYSWFGLSKLPFVLLPAIFKKYLYYYSTSRNLSFQAWRHFQETNSNFRSLGKKNIKNTFDLISAYEILFQLPNHYLMKVDKGTMAESVEARVPYLDYRVVEFVYSLKPEYKLKGAWQSFKNINEKYIFREIAKKYLPIEISQRKKKGGMLPIAAIIRSNISEIRDRLLDNNSLAISIFGRQKIEKLFSESAEEIGESNWHFSAVEREMFLWKLFILEIWHNSYFVV